MILEKNWDTFKKDIEDFILKAQYLILDYSKSRNQEQYVEYEKKFKELKKEIIEYLEVAFNDKNNSYAYSIRYLNSNSYTIGNQQKQLSDLVKKKNEDCTSLWKTLEYHLRILEISDAVVRPNEIDLKERKNLDTDEKLELILEKLNQLYDNSYHSLSAIIEGNGIELGRYDEERELAKALENYGYVRCMYARTISAQITLDGRRHIEKKLKKAVTDYSRIDKSQEELSDKIDEIIAILKKQNFGQEILFNELEELKELYSTLNKKNWGQVLKGKLIDLGLAQVINKDIMEQIFSELTDQILRLK
jgi:hypothetical protein